MLEVIGMDHEAREKKFFGKEEEKEKKDHVLQNMGRRKTIEGVYVAVNLRNLERDDDNPDSHETNMEVFGVQWMLKGTLIRQSYYPTNWPGKMEVEVAGLQYVVVVGSDAGLGSKGKPPRPWIKINQEEMQAEWTYRTIEGIGAEKDQPAMIFLGIQREERVVEGYIPKTGEASMGAEVEGCFWTKWAQRGEWKPYEKAWRIKKEVRTYEEVQGDEYEVTVLQPSSVPGEFPRLMVRHLKLGMEWSLQMY